MSTTFLVDIANSNIVKIVISILANSHEYCFWSTLLAYYQQDIDLIICQSNSLTLNL